MAHDHREVQSLRLRQILTVLSALPDAMYLPSCENETANTAPAWPSSVLIRKSISPPSCHFGMTEMMLFDFKTPLGGGRLPMHHG